jgi:N-methylhydantoinase B
LKVAEGRFQALCNHYGAAFLLQAGAALLDYAERWMRAEIRALPDGMYEFEDALEDDGVGSGPIKLHVRVTVRGDTLVADYSASDDQVRGPVNATYGVTLSATYNAIYQLVDTTIPRNGGCYRPITVIARPGCCLNVQFPAPCVGGNTETQPRIVFLILGALANAVPERVSACEGCTACNFLIGGIHPDTGEYYAHYHFEASGWGGRATKDGTSCQNHVIGNCRITPLEVFETRFPLLVLSYGLRTDSGGPGRFRGGLGSRRVLRVVAPEMRVSMLMDHALIGAWGLFGGAPGETASVKVKRAGTSEFRPFPEVFGTISPSKFADVHLFVGDEICLESAGGGGYGDPQSREPKRVLDDLAEGLISPSVAHDVYGMTDASVAG